MAYRMAFAGFRHGHIVELYDLARKRGDVQVVAAAEEHAPTREQYAAKGAIQFTHTSYDELFRNVDFDILAVGDYYGRRGELLIRGLDAGKHVIADKPICTRVTEIERIAELARTRKLQVGCQLTMRDAGNYRTLRQVVRSGRIGQPQTITFLGQHPLMRNSRAAWYFESPGHHGGTINDIAIHGVDAIPWITGRRIASIVAARVWNGGLTNPSWFGVGAQLMLKLDNGGGAMGDVSYLAPDSCGYRVNTYWRFTIHGSEGQAETASGQKAVTVYTNAGGDAEQVPAGPDATGAHFAGFLAEIGGQREGLELSTAEVLAASRLAVLAQKCADENLRDVEC
ncbi:MAG: Gfo/Idh/MocA family oxidoreductase [Phycisphaerae bacterium]|nr:Gfo/Idh/MocA family oxidoreductase [Phycisphaerae bacterium]